MAQVMKSQHRYKDVHNRSFPLEPPLASIYREWIGDVKVGTQEYIGICRPGSLYSDYIPAIFLGSLLENDMGAVEGTNHL